MQMRHVPVGFVTHREFLRKGHWELHYGFFFRMLYAVRSLVLLPYHFASRPNTNNLKEPGVIEGG